MRDDYNPDPCTEGIVPVVIDHPEDPTHRIVFLDTPGLDELELSKYIDSILFRVALWLKLKYKVSCPETRH